MQQYYFLFALAFIFTLFASIQDLKKREVANWVNFSFIAFALAYRAFYSLQNRSVNFFVLGVSGLIIFTALGYACYYGRVFAGGDAKLLMAFGIIIPFEGYSSLFSTSLLFFFLLFLTGAVYSLLYSVFIVVKRYEKFRTHFPTLCKKNKILIATSILASIVFIFASFVNLFFLPFSIIALVPILFVYASSLENCMTVLLPPSKLTEGDWIQSDIRISRNVSVKKTVHGLSSGDIKILKKYNRSVLVKEGIPFVPAFFLTLSIMVFFSAASKFSLDYFLSFLF